MPDCVSTRCLTAHGQLATLVYALNQYHGPVTAKALETATATLRNMSKAELVTYLLNVFDGELLPSDGSREIVCLACYSEQKLIEMLVYLLGEIVTTPT